MSGAHGRQKSISDPAPLTVLTSMLLTTWTILTCLFLLRIDAQQATPTRPSSTGIWSFGGVERLNPPRESQQQDIFFMVSTQTTSSFFRSVVTVTASSPSATPTRASLQTGWSTTTTTASTNSNSSLTSSETQNRASSTLKRSTHTATAYFVDTRVVPVAYNSAHRCEHSYLFISLVTALSLMGELIYPDLQ
ncbi:hypothetical protein K493DRAFT_384920 [Basidiobolus meristosporus CBS 931.73]|uniref:Uncharacterized protein n=1 Tax=Basidiobolus meristosporus CBS 931.73 TaxID=1314790 RepID=A0A1Y1YXW7_9FUNG|nr:hypothetical protein K493DRAFT_384920 [Basidiobolus meristosporus CBS 931.73]|eukprot:ORY02871.1 hypothetical protein K493DRAFT_384920 [Basidiobolus meristosporus CBS 931.73]